MEDKQQRILDYVAQHEEQIIEDLKQLVQAESPSDRKDLVDACGQKIRQLVKERLGIDGVIYPQELRGDHMTFTLGQGEGQILILAHFDTVWEPGRLTLHQEGDKLYGPGVLDMKGGLVASLWAMKACQDLGLPLAKKVCLLCNSDEEVGSSTSQALIEQMARQSSVVLCTEPAEAVTGNLKKARKGTGKYTITIYGKASHAGNDPQGGVSAVEEMAKQTLFLHSLTDYDKGTTVNVGVAQGGTRANIVAERAQMEVDVRTWTLAEAQRIDGIIQGLQPTRPGISLEVSGGIGRPALEFTPANQQAFALAQQAAEELGQHVEGAAVGGGSDGNFTSALGVPTLDGLGAVGDGPHAEREHIELSRYLPRVALLANLLTKF